MRIEGTVKRLSKEKSKYYYDRKPLFCKIRSYLMKHFPQSSKVDWEDVKKKHDELLKDVVEKKIDLQIPESQ